MAQVCWLGYNAHAWVEEADGLDGNRRPVLHISIPLKCEVRAHLNHDGRLKRSTVMLDWQTLVASVRTGCFTDDVWEPIALDARWTEWLRTGTKADMEAALTTCLGKA